MGNRNQRRVKAVLPLKIAVEAGGQTFLGHTVEISASGARTVLPMGLRAGCEITLEYKRRRCKARVAWCKPTGQKCDHEIGLQLLSNEHVFWMTNFAAHEEDDFTVKTELHFDRLWAGLKGLR